MYCDGIHKRAKRDSDSIKNCGLATTIFRYEHCELRMQFDRAVREAPEVMQVQMIDVEDECRASFSPRALKKRFDFKIG